MLKLYKHVIYNYVVKTIFYGKSKTEPVFQSFIHLYNTWKCVNNHRLNFTDYQPHNQWCRTSTLFQLDHRCFWGLSWGIPHMLARVCSHSALSLLHSNSFIRSHHTFLGTATYHDRAASFLCPTLHCLPCISAILMGTTTSAGYYHW